jgi:hypothetical protein
MSAVGRVPVERTAEKEWREWQEGAMKGGNERRE